MRISWTGTCYKEGKCKPSVPQKFIMGEAKRRKQRDPNYGKGERNRNYAKQNSIPAGIREVTVFEFGQMMYRHHGRGLVDYNPEALAGYYLADWLDGSQKAVVMTYNPSTQIALMTPLKNNDSDLVQTQIIESHNSLASLRISVKENCYEALKERGEFNWELNGMFAGVKNAAEVYEKTQKHF